MKKYIPNEIESKWQRKWADDKLFSPDLDTARKPYYSLMMFPYPSAEGLHVGNMYAFTGSDIYSRFKRMQGFDVFEPIGLDGFGIHSENYALKVNQHPMDLSKITEKRFYKQLHIIGNSYDWARTVETYKPNYYKWTQWLFLQMYKKGLATRKKASVNWCPKDLTVLADEQVINGACERCNSIVEKKLLEQWFFKITDYADRLLGNLEKLDWSEKVKIAQRDWIGKKEGINIAYPVISSPSVIPTNPDLIGAKVGIYTDNMDPRRSLPRATTRGGDDKIICFTTRPDTNFGATFIVVGPEHPLISKITRKEQLEQVNKYVERSLKKSEADRVGEGRKKTGVFTGSYAINNLNGKRLPIWVSDFVLGNVGTGAVVGVPGHDIRDFEFAKEFNLPVIRVVVGKDEDMSVITQVKQVQEEEGTMINSEFLDGMDIHKATTKIMDYLEEQGWGKRVSTYHLRDWLISRQRYWGPPIPIIYCGKCGIVPVLEKDLPIELPYIENFRPSGKGQSPLALAPDFCQVNCLQCGGRARRETDVSDTFLDSAWYFLRYPSTEFENKSFDQLRTEKWLPVNMYIGGSEHAVLHLLYSRFVTMVLNDLGLIDFDEPFTTFRAHGLIIKDGAKMSKSKGNIVKPDDYIKEYGADCFRTYLMFIGPFSEGGDFRDSSLNGIYRFLQRVWGLQEKATGNVILGSPDSIGATPESDSGHSASRRIARMTQVDFRIMHRTIKKVTSDIEQLKFNTAIAILMEWLNYLSRKEQVLAEEYQTLLLLLAPFAPHMTEELYQDVILGTNEVRTPESKEEDSGLATLARTTDNWSIHQQSWPRFDNKYLEEDEVSVIVQINGKVRDILLIQKDIISNKEVVEKMAKESKKVQKFLAGKSVEKVVYIEGKAISFLVEDH